MQSHPKRSLQNQKLKEGYPIQKVPIVAIVADRRPFLFT